jgi:hypothetical protein
MDSAIGCSNGDRIPGGKHIPVRGFQGWRHHQLSIVEKAGAFQKSKFRSGSNGSQQGVTYGPFTGNPDFFQITLPITPNFLNRRIGSDVHCQAPQMIRYGECRLV